MTHSLSAIMGNTNTLAYEVKEQIAFKNNNCWSLYDGTKQIKDGQVEGFEKVSMFKFLKAHNAERLPLAQRNIQKLRTLRHPSVLAFIDSTETEDSIALVTEPCIPLIKWLDDKIIEISENSSEVLTRELFWGLRCIVKALNFLHNNGSLIHGNLGMHSIFVTPSGDWKLGSMELACNLSLEDEMSFFLKYQNILDRQFCSPERLRLDGTAESLKALKAKLPPYYVDIFSLGHCIEETFSRLDMEVPKSFSKQLNTMINEDMKKRPTAKKLEQFSVFVSEHMKLLESVEELPLKTVKEVLEVIELLEPQVEEIPKSVSGHKILPSLCRTLQIAINDFSKRDARESCRQSVQVSINLLSKLATLNKLDEDIFRRSCVPILIQLWTMTDRAVRNAMLQSLKSFSGLIPTNIINKNIFDNILAGFSDSNAKMREGTLTSLIFVVDKLDDMLLQDRLVRCIVNLQNDVEASIRTNATIFLGKIASKLSDNVRVRMLANCCVKAMKDNFTHCRIAGLKTSVACVKFFDLGQVTTKIIPQASIMLTDKSAEVRTLSLSLMDACLTRLRRNHERLIALAKEQQNQKQGSTDSLSTLDTLKRDTSASSLPDATATADGSSLSSWTSWSMIQGISKTLENAAVVATNTEPNNTVAIEQEKSTIDGSPVFVEVNSQLEVKETHLSPPEQDMTQKHVKPNFGNWDIDDLNLDDDDEDDIQTDNKPPETVLDTVGTAFSSPKSPEPIKTPSSLVRKDSNEKKLKSKEKLAKRKSLDVKSPTSGVKKEVKPVVKKLDLDDGPASWDDF